MRKMSRAILPIMILSMAVASWSAAPQEHFCARVTVMDHLTDQVKPSPRPFAATEILDLFFYVEIGGNIRGDHILSLEIYTPKGHLYQELTAAVTTVSNRDGLRIDVPGYPKPMNLQRLTAVNRGEQSHLQARLSLPVAGTLIVSSALYGEWTAKVKIDGEPMTCNRPVRFTIAP
jgi:hypothetical protein